MFLLIAQASSAAAPAQPSMFEFLMPFVLMGVVFWLIVFRPRSGEQKKFKEMLDNLKKGDRVMTIGGVIATVVQMRDDEVVLKVDEATNTKMTFTRSAIKQVLSAGSTEPKSEAVKT